MANQLVNTIANWKVSTEGKTERQVEIEMAETRKIVASIVIGVAGKIGRAANLLDMLPFVEVWMQAREEGGELYKVKVRAPFQVKDFKNSLNSQIFSFDGQEVDIMKINGQILKDDEALRGQDAAFQFYKLKDPAHAPIFTLAKLSLFFYKVNSSADPTPIYARPDDSISTLKDRIAYRDNIPRRYLSLHFNG